MLHNIMSNNIINVQKVQTVAVIMVGHIVVRVTMIQHLLVPITRIPSSMTKVGSHSIQLIRGTPVGTSLPMKIQVVTIQMNLKVSIIASYSSIKQMFNNNGGMVHMKIRVLALTNKTSHM